MIKIMILLFAFTFYPNKANIVKDININSSSVDLIRISPQSMQVYHAINKYAPKHSIPYSVIYNVVKLETGWNGPLDLSYTYLQTSHTGAVGAMQFVMPTIKWLTDNDKLTKEYVKSNIDFNIKWGIYYLDMLYIRYDNMYLALTYYNTGYPKPINSYAKYAMEQ